MRTVYDYGEGPVERTTWRTYAVLAHTLSASGRIVGRALVRRLEPHDVDRTIERWCRKVFRLSHTSLVVEGLEHVDRDTAYVLLSTHESLLDIPACAATFPGRLRFVAKQELRQVPVFGRALEEAGIVFVDRGNRSRAITQLAAAREQLASGTSVWIAAEGRRNREGAPGALKKGGFHVAIGLGAPILPTWIDGTNAVLPPDQWGSVTGQTVTVRYGSPIPTAGLGVSDLPELMARTREAMLALRRPPTPAR